MINITELKWNNWVYGKTYSPRPMQVLSLGQDKAYFGYIRNSEKLKISYDYLEPVPLSIDILDVCDFYKSEDNFWVKRGGSKERILVNDNKFLWERCEGKYKEIKYVHELQNLFGAIGEKIEAEMWLLD